MDLILWRHAEAEDGVPDASRKLTQKGIKQAQKMAQWLKPRLPENTRIAVSPAKRTLQTASALTDRFETVSEVGVGATPRALLSAINWPNEDGTVLIVGHQPTLGQVASLLLSGNDNGISVKKGSIWWFSYKQKDALENISLRAMLAPEML